jgi:hypothetical protein
VRPSIRHIIEPKFEIVIAAVEHTTASRAGPPAAAMR